MKHNSFEVCALQIAVRTGRLYIIAVYRPPHSAGFFDEFRSQLDEFAAFPGGQVVCGDLSCPSAVVGHLDNKLERMVDEYDLLQHVKVPIHKLDGILDVIITSPGNPSVADVDV